MHHLKRLRRHARRCADHLRLAVERLLERAGEWWQWHWTRIAEEHGYAEALTAVLVEAVAMLTRSMRVRYLAHELLAVYVAVLRTLRRSHLGDDPA
jgi:hypothetical protein